MYVSVYIGENIVDLCFFLNTLIFPQRRFLNPIVNGFTFHYSSILALIIIFFHFHSFDDRFLNNKKGLSLVSYKNVFTDILTLKASYYITNS